MQQHRQLGPSAAEAPFSVVISAKTSSRSQHARHANSMDVVTIARITQTDLHGSCRAAAPGRQSACSRIIRAAAAAADDGATAARPDAESQPSNEELLARLRKSGIEALCAAGPEAPEHPRNLSLDFLFWLSDRYRLCDPVSLSAGYCQKFDMT